MKKNVILAIVFCFLASACKTSSNDESSKTLSVDTIFVNVDKNGNLTLGDKNIKLISLEKALTDSLNILLDNGVSKLPEFKLIIEDTGILMGSKGDVYDIFETVKNKYK
jgi:hypothetical protein